MKQHKRQFLPKPDRQAVIAGTKTMMRRVVEPQPPAGHKWAGWCLDSTHRQDQGKATWAAGAGPHLRDAHRVACPYGQPGNRLWVPEPWKIGAWNEYVGQLAIDYLDGPLKEWITVPEDPDDYHGGSVFDRYWIESTEDAIASGRVAVEGKFQWEPGQSPCRWRSLFSMPWWASRIWLEIVSVRVERLQDISEADALAEGVTFDPLLHTNARESFMHHWKSINGPGSWDANPWAWVVEFMRITPQTP